LKDEIKQIKRAKILETALALFSEQGFSGTSMESVADALGVTKPFIYTYFDNKNALLTAIYEQVTDELVAILTEALENEGDAPDKQLAFLIRQLARVNMNSRIAKVFLQEEKHLEKRFLKSVQRREKEFDKRMRALIERGVAMGIFHVEDAAVAGLAVTGMVRWIHRWYQPDGRLPADDIGRQIANLALQTLGAKPANPPRRKP
jgi:AcrR family transcriptional regulator